MHKAIQASRVYGQILVHSVIIMTAAPRPAYPIIVTPFLCQMSMRKPDTGAIRIMTKSVQNPRVPAFCPASVQERSNSCTNNCGMNRSRNPTYAAWRNVIKQKVTKLHQVTFSLSVKNHHFFPLSSGDVSSSCCSLVESFISIFSAIIFAILF